MPKTRTLKKAKSRKKASKAPVKKRTAKRKKATRGSISTKKAGTRARPPTLERPPAGEVGSDGRRAKTKKQGRKGKASQVKLKKRRKKVQTTVIEELWRNYKVDGSEVLRDELVLYYSPLVKYVAGRVASKLPPNVEAADLISYGMFGLIDAIEKFDLKRGVKFETYAITRIRGAIIDELRKIDWVPRLVRFRAKRLEEAYLSLLNKYKRSPTDKELARELDISVSELQDLMAQLSRTSQLTLEELWGKEGEEGEKFGLIDLLEGAGTQEPSAVLEFEEIKKVIAQVISELPRREKAIIALYYYRDLPLREIAEVLNLTESRVSQLHMKALFYLKMQLRRKKPLLLSK